jgi:GntR family transcriptional repressor for pyruvate dehydrogenase complex
MYSDKELFAPLKRRRTFEEVFDLIKGQILDGVFKPGDRLPSEGELARQFGLGRQTIREALRLLEHSGFIRVHKGGGGGVTIRDTVLQRMGELFTDACRAKRISVAELTEARAEIEQTVLKYLIRRATDSDIDLLRQNVAEARKKIDNKMVATSENFQFHTLLAKATKNPVFVMVEESLMAVHSALLGRVTLKTSEQTVLHHEAMLEMIENRDYEGAKRRLRRHVEDVGTRILPPTHSKNRR